MATARIILKQGRERSLFYRHPWVFSGGIDTGKSDLKVEDGSLADICDSGGNFLARGYYNSKTNIAARVLTFKDEAIDAAFFERRFAQAREMRRLYFEGGDTNAYRLVFAEGDMLAGLVVDNYDGHLVVQSHTAGMDKLMPLATEALVKFFAPKLVYEKSHVTSRREEGLEAEKEKVWFGELPSGLLRIRENGIEFLVDIVKGQKTGFFLDQRENRLACMPYFAGKKVLNLFCYTGGFSCYAAKAGATEITSVDSSKEAVEICEKNVGLNGGEGAGGEEKGAAGDGGAAVKHEAVAADAFEFLEGAKARGVKFEVVVVDPPAFVKSKKDLDAALKAYARVNEMALNVLAESGILITSSCSGHVTADAFKQSIFQAALRTGDDLVVMKSLGQPADHPNRIYFPEGSYLKFLILKKRGR